MQFTVLRIFVKITDCEVSAVGAAVVDEIFVSPEK